MRSQVLKGFALGMITGSFLTAGIVLAATPAKADPDGASIAYAAAYGEAVCSTLDEYPTVDGVYGVGKAIIKDGLTAAHAGMVVALSVREICPRHIDLIEQIAAQYQPGQVA